MCVSVCSEIQTSSHTYILHFLFTIWMKKVRPLKQLVHLVKWSTTWMKVPSGTSVRRFSILMTPHDSQQSVPDDWKILWMAEEPICQPTSPHCLSARFHLCLCFLPLHHFCFSSPNFLETRAKCPPACPVQNVKSQTWRESSEAQCTLHAGGPVQSPTSHSSLPASKVWPKN